MCPLKMVLAVFRVFGRRVAGGGPDEQHGGGGVGCITARRHNDSLFVL